MRSKMIGLTCLAVILILGLTACDLDEAYVQHKATEAEEAPSAGPPVAKFSPIAQEYEVGGLVRFKTTGTTTPNRWIESAAWDFGDGTAEKGKWSQTMTVTHRYTAPRSYVVTLTVTDNKGETDTIQHPLLIWEGTDPANKGGGADGGVSKTIEAWVVVRLAVEARLVAPSTAKFHGGGWSPHVAYLGGSRYRVHGSVDSQNGFGAMIRTTFQAVVRDEHTARKTWTIEELRASP